MNRSSGSHVFMSFSSVLWLFDINCLRCVQATKVRWSADWLIDWFIKTAAASRTEGWNNDVTIPSIWSIYRFCFFTINCLTTCDYGRSDSITKNAVSRLQVFQVLAFSIDMLNCKSVFKPLWILSKFGGKALALKIPPPDLRLISMVCSSFVLGFKYHNNLQYNYAEKPDQCWLTSKHSSPHTSGGFKGGG